jgi:transposase
VAQIAEYVVQAPVKQMDETRYPREGAGNWVWAVGTPRVVRYSLLPLRARYVVTSLVGEQFTGILVSDRYAVYHHVDAQKRQACWAHLIRDLIRIAPRVGLAGKVGRGLCPLPLARVGQDGRPVRPAAPAQQAPAGAGQHPDVAPAHGKNLRQPAQVTAGNVDVSGPSGRAANQQRGRAGTARAGAQAKDLRATRSKRGDEFLAHGFSVYETCRRQGRDLWSHMHEAVVAWIDKATVPGVVSVDVAAAPSG